MRLMESTNLLVVCFNAIMALAGSKYAAITIKLRPDFYIFDHLKIRSGSGYNNSQLVGCKQRSNRLGRARG